MSSQECSSEMNKSFQFNSFSNSNMNSNISNSKKKREQKQWTPQEDQLLSLYYQELNGKWSEISKKIPNRNASQCTQRWRRLNPDKTRKNWTKEEDQEVLELIKVHGKNWKLIADKLTDRNGKQVRERYINKLDPNIKRSEWTEEEDNTIIGMFKKIGPKWSEMSYLEKLKGRPENSIKNRFHSFLKKKVKNMDKIDEKSMVDEEEIQDDASEHNQIQKQQQQFVPVISEMQTPNIFGLYEDSQAPNYEMIEYQRYRQQMIHHRIEDFLIDSLKGSKNSKYSNKSEVFRFENIQAKNPSIHSGSSFPLKNTIQLNFDSMSDFSKRSLSNKDGLQNNMMDSSYNFRLQNSSHFQRQRLSYSNQFLKPMQNSNQSKQHFMIGSNGVMQNSNSHILSNSSSQFPNNNNSLQNSSNLEKTQKDFLMALQTDGQKLMETSPVILQQIKEILEKIEKQTKENGIKLEN